jgi:hypothetical protein
MTVSRVINDTDVQCLHYPTKQGRQRLMGRCGKGDAYDNELIR